MKFAAKLLVGAFLLVIVSLSPTWAGIPAIIPSDSAETVADLAVDALGNLFAVGYFSDTCNFGTTENPVVLTSLGDNDGFFAKYNWRGELLWVKRIGGQGYHEASCISLDPQGNAYLGGYLTVTTYFDSDPGVLIVTGSLRTGFVAKYSSSGEALWVKASAPGMETPVVDVSFDADGNVYCVEQQGLIKSYSPTGTVRWAGGPSLVSATPWSIRISSIAAGSDGAVTVAGTFSGEYDFDFGPGTTLLTSDPDSDGYFSSDLFLVRYAAADGSLSWAHRIGNGYNTATPAGTMALDQDNNIVLAGTFAGPCDFDLGPGVFELTTLVLLPGEYAVPNMFLAKYTPAGGFLWAFQLDNSGIDAGMLDHTVDLPGGLCVKPSGETYLTGYVLEAFDADPDVGVTMTGTTGEWGVFAIHYAANGQFLWEQSMTTATSSGGDSSKPVFDLRAVAADDSGNVYLGGDFEGTVDFDPGIGVISYTTNWEHDAYISKLTPTGNLWLDPGCCVGTVGNLDGDPGESVDITDLQWVLDRLFFPPPPEIWCMEEWDMAPDGGIDIADLQVLIDFLFFGTPLPQCPRP